MKKILLISFLLVGRIAYSQDHPGFYERHILGKGKKETLQINFDVYPFLFLSEGGGGSIALENNHWQAGLTGFSVVPPEFIKNTFFENADNVSIRRNKALELFANYYLRQDRKGIYGGILGGPEWFRMEDKLSGKAESFVKSYLVPRLGLRVFPFKKYFYVDASFGWSFNLSGTETKTLGHSSYNASGGGFIYFLQAGARFNLRKQED